MYKVPSSSNNIRLSTLRSHFLPISTMTSGSADSSYAHTIFDKIIKREAPANIVFEDDKVLAFRDINPQASTHILIIPKARDGLTHLSKAEERHCEILGRLMFTAKLVAKQEGLDNGFRIVINNGPIGGQDVFHLHVHLLGGRQMNWPPG